MTRPHNNDSHIDAMIHRARLGCAQWWETRENTASRGIHKLHIHHADATLTAKLFRPLYRDLGGRVGGRGRRPDKAALPFFLSRSNPCGLCTSSAFRTPRKSTVHLCKALHDYARAISQELLKACIPIKRLSGWLAKPDNQFAPLLMNCQERGNHRRDQSRW